MMNAFEEKTKENTVKRKKNYYLVKSDVLGLFNFGNLIMAFVGMLGLKISAYLQPLFMKVTDRFSGRSDASSAGEMETE